ncbi:MAG: hypothetical protein EXS17_07565 [Phycisphaerales bacterium]|nr:hypothetical protein [Phycisphaerales bacterium]
MNGSGIKTGFFLLSGLLAFVFVGVTLTKLDLFTNRTPYVVGFSISDGVLGLATGSDVRVGGLQRGQVSSIEPILNDEGQLTALHVHIEVDPEVRLYSDAVAMRILPLLGTSASINFIALGAVGDPLAPGSLIQAAPSSGVLASLLGPYNATKADQIVDNLTIFSKFLATVPTEYSTRVVPVLENANTVVADLRTDYSSWRAKITGTLAYAETSAQKLDASLADVQALLTRNGPKFDAAVTSLDTALANANDALKHINQETLGLVDSALREAESTVDGFGKSVDIVHNLLLERSPDIAESLSNIRAASGQLKLAAMEVRRSPWKILYQPNSDQIAHENLYESARSFAMAAGDLRAAGDSLRLVVERDPGRYESDAKFREAVQSMVLDALTKYELAQKQLNDVLMAPAPVGESQPK